jgi:hypothetical protein
MVDFENDVGPIRQIPGTQNTRDPPPGIAEEPEWMKLSTVMGLKAGGVIFRDLRAWVSFCPVHRLAAVPLTSGDPVPPDAAWWHS